MMHIQRQLDDAFQRAMDAGLMPGVTVAVSRADEVLYAGSYGVRRLGDDVPMTADTVCWIASMTKAITATAAMLLVERGALHLDQPAAEIVPEIAAAEVLIGFGDDGQAVTRPVQTAITLRHLLTHTAGFSYDTWDDRIYHYRKVTDTPAVGSGQLKALTTPLVFEPGSDWAYSIGIDWAGQMVEAVSGQSLGAFMQAELFQPLKMASTGFQVSADMRARRASVHQRDADSHVLTVTDFELPTEVEFEGGGGSLYSTVEDYLSFCRLFLNQGRVDKQPLLSPETVATMSRNQIGALRVKPMRTVQPRRSNDAEFMPGIDKTWGLSFMINQHDVPGRRHAGSLAWAGLSNCYYWIDPTAGVTGVFMSQVLPLADPIAHDLFDKVEQATYAAL
jgi:CubicO group peptidase (beta-lactamase class C family)